MYGNLSVLGTLPQFLRMGKVNTIGVKQANKYVHLSSIILKRILNILKTGQKV